MEQGAIQRSIAEFSHSLLTNAQQLMLSRTLSQLQRVSFRGVQFGSVVVVGNTFIKGMSAVATDLLDLSNVDVIIFVYVNCRGTVIVLRSISPTFRPDDQRGHQSQQWSWRWGVHEVRNQGAAETTVLLGQRDAAQTRYASRRSDGSCDHSIVLLVFW
jgi:hypothetical protein